MEAQADQNAYACMHKRMADLRDFLKQNGFVFAIVVVVLMGVIVAWGFEIVTYSGGSAPTYDGKLVAETTEYPFEFTITLEKTTFKPYEHINLTVTLTNIGEENVTITFSTRPNPSPYWFWRVYDERQQLVFYHKCVIILPAFEEITLHPGEFMQRECAWDQKATDNGQQVPPGIYYLTAVTSFMYNKKAVHLETRLEILIEP